jgi:uncharacterized membrane protein
MIMCFNNPIITSLNKQFTGYSIIYIQNSQTMNTKLLGIALIILGAIMLIWTGFTYTKKEKVVDAGPIEISADKQKSVNWPPYLGGVLLIGGIVIVATSKKTS